MKLFVGTRITAFYFHRNRTYKDPLARGTVLSVKPYFDTQLISWRTAVGVYGPSLRADREGIDWIRGHHNENSEEIKALIAAATLVSE